MISGPVGISDDIAPKSGFFVSIRIIRRAKKISGIYTSRSFHDNGMEISPSYGGIFEHYCTILG
jgi:hypothetical protein